MACLQKMRIPTNSMAPTLAKGTLVTVDMIFNANRNPKRFDLVVLVAPQVESLGQKLGQTEFRAAATATSGRLALPPQGEAQGRGLATVVNVAAAVHQKEDVILRPHMFYVKRVVGLPGESIEVADDGILVNGRALRLPGELGRVYASVGKRKGLAYGGSKYKIPDKSVFVMADNHQRGTDSRHLGAIPIDFIVGRVVV